MITFNYLFPVDDFKTKEVRLKQWIIKVIHCENKRSGDIAYVFCNDEQLHEINLKFLDHDTLTDIITFPTTHSNEIISGEIYISIPRVFENATHSNGIWYDELSRVIIHGILHLIGYDDHSPEEKVMMRAKEDYYLTLRP
jgi:rRNA maturation RNase YbeY